MCHRTVCTLVLSLGAACLSAGDHAAAAVITFNNESVKAKGTGFGAVLTVLSLKQHANGTTEWGSIGRSGNADAVTNSANVTNQSQTRTVSELMAKGVNSSSDFGLVFNVNEPGNATDVRLHDFAVDFYNNAGALLFSAPFDAMGGLTLGQVGGGQGGAGWLFRLADLTPTEEAFFSTSTNRVGMSVTSDNAFELVAGGADNFHILDPASIPEPTSLALLGMTFVGFWGTRPRRRRKAVAPPSV